jgi:hypothetical protein
VKELEMRAKDDFFRARSREMVTKILSILTNDEDDLLPLDEARKILKPKAEVYRGLTTVPISKVVGSEGRYRDFNKNFLPRHSHLRARWESIDIAHHRDVILPPVRLYELGGVYFVRDGNHRISVAALQGVEFIDAEVTKIDSNIELKPGATKTDLKRAVLDLERKHFYKKTGLLNVRPQCGVDFTETGRYDDLLQHIDVHKYYLNLHRKEEISYQEGVLSWYENVYSPIVAIIRQERLLPRFPGRTEADLYVWIVRHWDELKGKYGQDYSLREAAKDYSEKHGKNVGQIFRDFIGRIFGRLSRR